LQKKQPKAKKTFVKPAVIARGKENITMNICGRAGCQGK
jgi:hypothetical protein